MKAISAPAKDTTHPVLSSLNGGGWIYFISATD